MGVRSKPPLTYRQAKPLHGWAALLVGILLMAMAPLAVVPILIVDSQSRASKDWPTAQGVIARSGLSRVKLLNEEKYQADVKYHFQVNGRDYSGTRISFMSTTGSSEKAQYALIEPYPVGAEVTVYYDPDDPSSSILVPGSGSLVTRIIFYAIPLLLAGFGVFLFLMQRAPYQEPAG